MVKQIGCEVASKVQFKAVYFVLKDSLMFKESPVTLKKNVST